MGNQWFQFKQFKINQDKTAMKVGTDGVLLGAWTEIPLEGKVLDVGTGTGLIALMIAQRNPDLNITAIDVEQDAVVQAIENVENSKFSSSISVLHHSFHNYASQAEYRFDLIVCNPPFYKTSNPGNDKSRAIARHADALSLDELVSNASRILSSSGLISLILPSEQFEDLKSLSRKHQIHIQKVVWVKPIPQKSAHRILVQLGHKKVESDESTLIIEEFGRHKYSQAFKELVAPFYLNV